MNILLKIKPVLLIGLAVLLLVSSISCSEEIMGTVINPELPEDDKPPDEGGDPDTGGGYKVQKDRIVTSDDTKLH